MKTPGMAALYWHGVFIPSGTAATRPRRRRRYLVSSGMIRIATMLVILIIGLIAGPAVSL